MGKTTAMVVARAPMITHNPQPALNVKLSSADRAVAGSVEEKQDSAKLDSVEMTLTELDDLLEELPEDFNGILVY